MRGSSPRMRGKLLIRRLDPGLDRLIPAHAGKTSSRAWLRAWCRAHPRACGENLREDKRRGPAPGSSPRMRGKRCISFSLSSGWGLIPAHAGKTRASPATSRQPTAHPRACGENIVFKNAFAALNGSSPRMRGKRRRRPRCARRSGLIPAHAGKTRQPCYQQSNHPAHPRACGENLHIEGLVDTPYGSSPRMRGKRLVQHVTLITVGLIPAHAGKTLLRSRCMNESRAHPRACGENAGAVPPGTGTAGSSPRMRGKRFLDL